MNKTDRHQAMIAYLAEQTESLQTLLKNATFAHQQAVAEPLPRNRQVSPLGGD